MPVLSEASFMARCPSTRRHLTTNYLIWALLIFFFQLKFVLVERLLILSRIYLMPVLSEASFMARCPGRRRHLTINYLIWELLIFFLIEVCISRTSFNFVKDLADARIIGGVLHGEVSRQKATFDHKLLNLSVTDGEQTL